MRRSFLLLLCVCAHLSPFAQKYTLHKTYYGAMIAYGEKWCVDTMWTVDPVDHAKKAVVLKDWLPERMNGKEILFPAKPVAPRGLIEEKILARLEQSLPVNQFDDGKLEFELRRVVIDEQGRLVFIDQSHTYITGENEMRRDYGEYPETFNHISRLPTATHNGKKVPYLQRIFLNDYNIWVKGHHISYEKVKK